jgi:hypothetical protein
MIKRAVAGYNGKLSRSIMLDGYVAVKLGCTPFQASRAIVWADGVLAQ